MKVREFKAPGIAEIRALQAKLHDEEFDSLLELLDKELGRGPPGVTWWRVRSVAAEHHQVRGLIPGKKLRTEGGYRAIVFLACATALLKLALKEQDAPRAAAAVDLSLMQIGGAEACIETMNRLGEAAQRGGLKNDTRTAQARAHVALHPSTTVAYLAQTYHLSERWARRLLG